MNSTVQDIDAIAAWVQQNVCSHFRLKKPNDDYPVSGLVELVEPTAYPCFLPALGDNTAPEVEAIAPCILVQLSGGSDNLVKHEATIKVRLCISTFSIGDQSGAVIEPAEESGDPFSRTFTVGKDGKLDGYTMNNDGWRDTWNIIDRVRRELAGCESVAGLAVDSSTDVEYGFFTVDDAVWYAAPYWHSYITFTLKRGAEPPQTAKMQEFL